MPNLEISSAELIMPFRNFSGKESRYNPPGKRGFSVYIPSNIDPKELEAEGWNVKWTKPRSEDQVSRPYLNVAVNFEIRPPVVMVGTDKNRMHYLDDSTISELDWADIVHVDLAIRPRHFDVNGTQGIKAYLAEMYVIINQSNFSKEYNVEAQDEIPFN